MGFNIGNAALRLVTGAYILNSGIGKRNLDAEHAAMLQGAAAHAIPPVGSLEPVQFGKYLSYLEIGVGSILLIPFIPSRVAGLALGAFSGGLVATYLKSPGMTEADGIRPTTAGSGMAKDFWMVGIAVALVCQRKRP